MSHWRVSAPDVGALDAALEIGDSLSAVDASRISPSDLADLALFFAYLATFDTSRDWRSVCELQLNIAIDRSSALPPLGFAFFGGLTRVAWVTQHVRKVLAQARDDDPLTEFDSLLLDRLQAWPNLVPFDLISGLVGLAVYCLERLPSPGASAALALILAELERRADRSWGGAAWLTPAMHTSSERAERWPNGYFDLGVAHGTPAVLFVLSEMSAAGIEAERASALLEQGLQWLLARRRPPSSLTRFSNWFIPGEPCRDSRLGWCYGDLGISAVLLPLAARLERADVQTFALATLRRLAEVDCRDGHLSDMMLCHGSLGVSHIFSRMFALTTDDVFRHAAARWCAHGLSQRQVGFGVSGFYSYIQTSTPRLTTDYSLLTGAAGCGLALLSLSAPIVPNWDRCLGLSGIVAPHHLRPHPSLYETTSERR